jgi:hypothetical protein
MSEISVAPESPSRNDLSKPPSQAVVEAVASAEGLDPLELPVPLYDAIDPDALDALFQDDDTDGRVEFSYYGYDVTVTDVGDVRLEESIDGL